MTWTKDSYYTKASLFWGRATALSRDSIEYYINFSLFAEHVVRAALVAHNPALNAARDEESLLFASGIDARTPPKTIELSKAVGIIKRLIPEISDQETKSLGVLIDFRNTEFHDDKTQFDAAVLRQIVPDCQALMLRLMESTGDDPTRILGNDDAKQFTTVRSAKTGDRNKRVKGLIDTCKDRFYHLSEAEQKRKRDEGAPQFITAVMTSGRHLRTEKCPACAGLGILSGPPQGKSAPMLKEDDLVVEVRVIPDAFDCKICDLSVKGLDELLAAGFTHEFTSIDSVDIVEHFGIDPMEYVDTEEIIREYHEEEYGYQDE